MTSPLAFCLRAFRLLAMHLLITAGPTREHLDSVRFLSNPSSGRFGYAIAEAAAARGHRVSLVSGPVDLPEPPGVDVIRVISAHAMFRAATALFDECQAAIMAAAVCDFRPAKRYDHKLPKGRRPRSITLVPTEDICAHLGHIKADRVVVGFSLEDHDHQRHAEEKLKRKNCDAIVLNNLGNIGADAGEVQVLSAKGGWASPIHGAKKEMAGAIVAMTESLVASKFLVGNQLDG